MTLGIGLVLTPGEKIKKPSVELLCQWIKTSWQWISPEVTVRGFKKCCLSNVMDERENNSLWEVEEESGNIGSECGSVSKEYEKEDENCEDRR
jgi:hypothetical protein